MGRTLRIPNLVRGVDEAAGTDHRAVGARHDLPPSIRRRFITLDGHPVLPASGRAPLHLRHLDALAPDGDVRHAGHGQQPRAIVQYAIID